MKRVLIGGVTALALLCGPVAAQEATMDPAVVEQGTASSAASLIGPILIGLILLAVVTASPAAAPVTIGPVPGKPV